MTGQEAFQSRLRQSLALGGGMRAARAAFEGPWSKMTPSERGRLIWRIGDLILAHADELAQLESLDNGKPFAVARGADVPLAADLFHYMAGWATKIEGNSINISVPYMPGANFHSYTLREPLGVVGQIIPWNFPLLMAAWKLGPALATGNCVCHGPAGSPVAVSSGSFIHGDPVHYLGLDTWAGLNK